MLPRIRWIGELPPLPTVRIVMRTNRGRQGRAVAARATTGPQHPPGPWPCQIGLPPARLHVPHSSLSPRHEPRRLAGSVWAPPVWRSRKGVQPSPPPVGGGRATTMRAAQATCHASRPHQPTPCAADGHARTRILGPPNGPGIARGFGPIASGAVGSRSRPQAAPGVGGPASELGGLRLLWPVSPHESENTAQRRELPRPLPPCMMQDMLQPCA